MTSVIGWRTICIQLQTRWWSPIRIDVTEQVSLMNNVVRFSECWTIRCVAKQMLCF